MAGCLSCAAAPRCIGGETREEALIHIENAISMILAEIEFNGVTPPPNEPVPGGVLLNIPIG
jgi:predicted RNase H-like HicB family nuclease